MTTSSKDKYLELRTRNGFGAVVDLYFDFLKQNFKLFFSLYLRYNAISIIFTLLACYLLVTGYLGTIGQDFRFGGGSNIDSELYVLWGFIILILMLLITALINLSFSSAFVAEYVNTQGKPETKGIWRIISTNLGSIVVYILLGVLIYIGFAIISVVLAYIPYLGAFLQYCIGFLISTMFGLIFMAIFAGNPSVSEAFNEGWEFTTRHFSKVFFYGVVIGILNLMIIAFTLSLPGFVIGIYFYFSAESGVDLASSPITSIILTLGFSLFILGLIFSRALSQVAHSILFYNLHEVKHNSYLQSRIKLIGKDD